MIEITHITTISLYHKKFDLKAAFHSHNNMVCYKMGAIVTGMHALVERLWLLDGPAP